MASYEANLERYEDLVAANPTVERKGATMPYTSMNGHMFSFLTPKGALALRLPDDALEAFKKKYKAKHCEQHGRVMKEYVEVPDALLKKPKEIQKYFAESVAYVGSLKPKATKNKPAKKKAAAKKKTPKKK